MPRYQKILVKLALVIVLTLFLFFPAAFSATDVDFLKEIPDVTSLSIGFTGDIFMHDTNILAGYNALTNQYNFDSVFEYVKDILAEPDFTASHLGANYSEAGPYSGYPIFISPAQLLGTLRRSGIDIVFATNHVVDGGRHGFLDRQRLLEENGLLHPGEFATEEQSEEILVLEKKDIRVALLAYTYGTNGLPVPEKYMVNIIDKKKMRADIAKAKARGCDFIVVSLHQGIEYQKQPSPEQRDTARFLHEQGVDLIVSSHPHVVEPSEILCSTAADGSIHTTRVLTYSMGNFYCAQITREQLTGIFVRVEIEKDRFSGKTKLKSCGYRVTYILSRKNGRNRFYRVLPVRRTLREYDEGKNSLISEKEASELRAALKETVVLVENREADFYLIED